MQKSDCEGVKEQAAKQVQNRPSNVYDDIHSHIDICLKTKPLPLLYQLLCSQLLRHSNYDNLIPFGSAVNQAIGDIQLTHDEQISALKELEKAGVIKKVDFKGWKIMTQED